MVATFSAAVLSMAMSNVEELTYDALRAAQADTAKARRALWLAAAVLALLHLLTVQPYLETRREAEELEPKITANAAMLAQLERGSARLEQAGKEAEERLRSLLDEATETMIEDFARLRDLVAQAERGDVPLAWSDGSGAPTEAAQMPQMQMQQMAPVGAQMPNLPARGSTIGFSPALRSVLEAIADQEPDAYERLVDYARRDIVEAAYGEVQRRWAHFLRPAYLQDLESMLAQVRGAVDEADSFAQATIGELRAAAAELQSRRDRLATLEIRPDAEVDAAVGTDWWRTVEGKGTFADAVAESIAEQMRDVSTAAAAPAATLERILDLQQKLRAELETRQEELERQFAQAQQNLATLSGAGGVLPIDLVASIGLFPLLVGLVLAALILRGAQARRQAALAAEELGTVAPSSLAMRRWLTRQALGGSSPATALLATVAVGLAVVAWISLAAAQISDSPLTPPLSPWRALALAVPAVIAALAWDAVMIWRLKAAAH